MGGAVPDCKTRTDKINISHSYCYYDSVRDHLSELNLHYTVAQSDVVLIFFGGGWWYTPVSLDEAVSGFKHVVF